jgi:hypothetical protein
MAAGIRVNIWKFYFLLGAFWTHLSCVEHPVIIDTD